MKARLTPGAAYRLPSGRRAFFDRFIESQKGYKFVYEDDGSEIRERQFLLSEENVRLAVPELGR